MAFSLQLIGPMVFDPDDPPLPTLKLTNQSTLYRVSGEKNFIQVFMSFLPKPSIKRDPETFQFQKQRCKKRWIQCRSREKPSKEEKKENLIVHQKLLYNIKLAWNFFEDFQFPTRKKEFCLVHLVFFSNFWYCWESHDSWKYLQLLGKVVIFIERARRATWVVNKTAWKYQNEAIINSLFLIIEQLSTFAMLDLLDQKRSGCSVVFW